MSLLKETAETSVQGIFFRLPCADMFWFCLKQSFKKGTKRKVWYLKKSLKQDKTRWEGGGRTGRKRVGCITGPRAVYGGPLEEAAVSAPPSSPVSPAWRCPALWGAPAGEGVNSATWRTTSQPLGSLGCPCWAWWGQSRALRLCPCHVQRHLPGTRTCDSGPSDRRTEAAKSRSNMNV